MSDPYAILITTNKGQRMKTETVKVHAMDTTTNEWVWWLIDEDMADEFADSLLDCGFIFDRVDHTPEWLAENE